MNDSDRTYLWNHFLSRDATGTFSELVAFVDAQREADRNAVRLALLDELIALDDESEDTLSVDQAVAMLRLKYTPPRGKL